MWRVDWTVVMSACTLFTICICRYSVVNVIRIVVPQSSSRISFIHMASICNIFVGFSLLILTSSAYRVTVLVSNFLMCTEEYATFNLMLR